MLAHLEQFQAAEQWNRRWPDEPKMLKNFSYWENWSSSTGHAPSLTVLGRLAQLDQCSVSDLVVDLPDYRHQDSAQALALTDATRAAAEAESLLVDLVGTVHTEVARFESDGGDSQERHFYQSEAVFWATIGMGNCALRLGEPDRALDAISKSLVIGDPTHVHNRFFGCSVKLKHSSRKMRSPKPAGSSVRLRRAPLPTPRRVSTSASRSYGQHSHPGRPASRYANWTTCWRPIAGRRAEAIHSDSRAAGPQGRVMLSDTSPWPGSGFPAVHPIE